MPASKVDWSDYNKHKAQGGTFKDYKNKEYLPFDDSAYEFRVIESQGDLILDWVPMIRQLVYDIKSKRSISQVSQKFHNGLSRGLTLWAEIARKNTGLTDIVLSGGVFMNIYLLTRLKKVP
ncbi:MAG: hypothetical protein Q7J65_04415 [Candidatus Marinimicrobia bacterium]|nr:hypothetical protein [Candidatus Neomarinimicrobiota bacterium]